MNRFILSASIAAMGLFLLAAPQTQAASRSGGDSHRGGHFDYRFSDRSFHGFHADFRFGYDRYGYRSLSYSHYRWSNDYHCYLYWSPSYSNWFFYVPTYSYYVPVSYFSQVYPSYTPTAPTSSAIQQTSVVVNSAPSVAPVVGAVPPGPIGPVTPAPVAVQNNKVGPGPGAP